MTQFECLCLPLLVRHRMLLVIYDQKVLLFPEAFLPFLDQRVSNHHWCVVKFEIEVAGSVSAEIDIHHIHMNDQTYAN